jgi:hypothetical protein
LVSFSELCSVLTSLFSTELLLAVKAAGMRI